MDLSKYLKQREKDLKISHKQFIEKLSQLQKRTHTNLTRNLVDRRHQLHLNYANMASKSLMSSILFFKLETGQITPSPEFINIVALTYKIPKNKLISDIKEDLIDDLVAIFSLTREEFVRNYGAEVAEDLKRIYEKNTIDKTEKELKAERNLKAEKKKRPQKKFFNDLSVFGGFSLIGFILPCILYFTLNFKLTGLFISYMIVVIVLLIIGVPFYLFSRNKKRFSKPARKEDFVWRVSNPK